MNDERDYRSGWLAALPLTTAAIPPVVGGLLTLVIVSIVAAVFDPSALTRRLLAPVGGLYIQAVPAATLYLFLWAMIELGLKARQLVEEDQALREAEARGTRDLARELIHGSGRVPMYRRLLAPLRPLLEGAEAADCHDVFRHHVEIEATESARRYTLVRVFIWAMPILGFIGTVIGIGIAVGEFSGFLTGNIEDLERVKGELSKVSTGLSFAFDTTLLGLLTSLVAMLTVSAVQGREERLLSEAEGFALDLLARTPVRARPRGTTVPVRVAAPEVIVSTEGEALVASMGQTSAALTEAVGRVPGVLGRLDSQIAALREAIDAHREAMSSDTRIEEAAALIGEASKSHREALNRLAMLPEVTGALRAIGASVSGQTEQLKSLGVVVDELRRLTSAQQATAGELTTVAPQIEAVRNLLIAEQKRFGDSMRTVPEALSRLDGQIAALRDAIGAQRDVLSGGGRIEQMIDVMVDAGKSHREALARLEQLPEVSTELQAIATSVAGQTEQLRGLATVMDELRSLTSAQRDTAEGLAAMSPVVGVLRNLFTTEQQTIAMLGSLAVIPDQVQQLGQTYEEASRKLAVLARIPDELRDVVETHEATVEQMRSFESVLSRLAEVVGRSSRVLESLTTPLEFRMVAAPRDGNEEKK